MTKNALAKAARTELALAETGDPFERAAWESPIEEQLKRSRRRVMLSEKQAEWLQRDKAGCAQEFDALMKRAKMVTRVTPLTEIETLLRDATPVCHTAVELKINRDDMPRYRAEVSVDRFVKTLSKGAGMEVDDVWNVMNSLQAEAED